MDNPGLFHIGERIFKNLDFKNQLNCRLVRRSWNDMIEFIADKAKIDLDMLLESMKNQRSQMQPTLPHCSIT